MGTNETKSRRERISDLLYEHTRKCIENQEINCGMQTTGIAEKLGLNRANVSRELNTLYRDGSVIKILGKPTLYLHRAAIMNLYPDSFFPMTIPKDKSIYDYIQTPDKAETPKTAQPQVEVDEVQVGLDGSLRKAFLQATAAVRYPPHGLHILITGNPGSGKLSFAKAIHKYAVENGIRSQEAPFLVCDCRKYQSSPNTLLLQLFGEGKKTSSSSVRSHRGLIERAFGGILCLDGADTLEGTVRQQLISLMETHTYSRVYEAGNNRVSNTLLILLSSSPPDAPVLGPIMYSIPFHISIPDLGSRGLKELLEYISVFFQEESARIGTSFRVDKETLCCLLSASYPGNVSELKSMIKRTCALSYQDYITASLKASAIDVTVSHLASNLLCHIADNPENTDRIQAFLSGFEENALIFSPGSSPFSGISMEMPPSDIRAEAPHMPHIPVIALFHGNGRAEATADYINSVCAQDVLTGISYTSSTTLEEISQKAAEIAKEKDNGNGVLIVTDMEPLSGLYREIGELSGVETDTFLNLSLVSLLSLCRAAMHTDLSVHGLVNNTLQNGIHAKEDSYIDRIIKEVIAPSLTFLNPTKAATVLMDILNKILNDLSIPYSDELAVRFVVHCSYMLERLIRGTSLKYERLKSFTNEHNKTLSLVENQMQYLCDSFGVTIPASELAYITEIFIG